MAISSPTQDFVVSSGLNVQGTGTVTSSTGNTSTLQVDGGAAIAKNAIIGGTVEIYGDTTIHGNMPYLSVTGTSTLATVTAGYTTATQLDVTTRLLVGGLSQLNNVTVTNPTNSTATTNGALVVTGGVGIGGNLYAGTIYSNGQQVLTSGAGGGFVSGLTAGTDTVVSTATGAITIWNTSTLQSVTNRGAITNNAISITNTSTSTSTNTGALVIAGGAGLGGDLYVGGNEYIQKTNITASSDSVAAWVYDSTATYASTVTNQDIFFKPDGTKMFGISTNAVFQWSLGTPWSFTSVTSGTTYSLATVDTAVSGLTFSPDGAKMVITGQTAVANATFGIAASEDRAYYFTLATPWDPSSATLAGTIRFVGGDLGIPNTESTPQACAYDNTGGNFYVIGTSLRRVYQYTLSAPYVVSTSTAVYSKQYITAEDTSPQGLSFNYTGSRMYILGATNDNVSEYRLSIPWDVTTAVYYDKFFIGLQNGSMLGLYTNSTVTNYVFMAGSTAIYRYRTDTQAAYINPETTQSNIILGGLVRVKGSANSGILVVDSNIYTFGTSGFIPYNNQLTAGQSGVTGGVFTGISSGGLNIYTGQSSGALVVGGGVATGNITIGQSTAAQAVGIASGATTSGTTKTVNIGTNGTTSSITTINIGSVTTGSLGVLTIGGTQTIIVSTTTAISTNTGALQVRGGVGIGGDLYVGGVMTITNTSSNTGTIGGNALQVTGGVGIGGGMFVQGQVTFASNVIFAGTTTYVLTTNTVYTDNIIELHYTSTWTVNDGKDIGLRFHYYDDQDRNAFLGRDNATGYLEWVGQAGDDTQNNITGTNGTFRTGAIVLTGTTASVSTSTGALTVTGGVGIGGALYVNTTSFVNGSQILTTATVNQYANQTSLTAGTDTVITTSTGNITIWNTGTLQSVTNRGATTTNAINVTNTTNSTSTITGAIVVTGGGGIGKDLYVGGAIYSNGQQVLTSGAGGGFVSSITAGTDTAVSTSTGAITIWDTSTLQSVTGRGSTTTNAISITNTASSTSTTTGALRVSGGAGIGGDLYVAGGITATNVAITSLTLNRVPFVSTGGKLIDNANFYVDNANALFYAGGGGAYIGGTGGFGTVASTIALINTATVIGFNARLNVVGPSYLSGSLYVTGVSTLTNTTSATSTTTGALQVTGGVGIGGKLFVGGLANNTSSYIAYYNTTTGELGFGVNPVQQTLVALNTASASFFPTFVDSNNSVATAESFYTTSSFTINPATGNVTVGTTAASLSTSTSTGALQVRGGVGIADSVYVGNRVGFVGTTQASVVYQFYNTLTNSLDTVFG
jgi:hypothetical protein